MPCVHMSPSRHSSTVEAPKHSHSLTNYSMGIKCINFKCTYLKYTTHIGYKGDAKITVRNS